MCILGHSEEAEMFQVTIYIGERQQSAIAHIGKVFPIDMDREDIIRQKSGVLSFSLVGMGSSFFRDVPPDIRGSDKVATVHFSIIKSKEPRHLAGLHQFCQKGKGKPEDARHDDPDFDRKRLPYRTPPPSSRAASPAPQ